MPKTIYTNFSTSTGFIREKELIKQIPFSHSTLYRKVNSGDFPKPIKLSERVTAWKMADIRDWMIRLERKVSGKPFCRRRPITPRHLRKGV